MAAKTVTGAQIVADTRRYLGIPYVYGGGPNNPQAGLDCSGLVERVCFDLGLMACPRTSEEQYSWCQHADTPSTGDLVFFVGSDGESSGIPGHVGIVVTPGVMIDAPYTGTVVRQEGFPTNGTGANQLVGYGHIPRTQTSTSANTSTTGEGFSVTQQAGGIAGAVAGVVSFLVVAAVFLIIVGLLIFGLFLLYKGRLSNA